MSLRSWGVGLSSLLLLSVAACAEDKGAATDDEDLTGVTARSRTLEFEGTVYVAAGADDFTVMQAVRTQAQTAFGPLRTQDMAVNSRELETIDASTFRKRTVQVVDGSRATDMLEVKYTYSDDAVVAASYANRSAVPLAIMTPGYDGSGASYRDLLLAAEATESLRVVDGELDNTWTPATKVTVSKK